MKNFSVANKATIIYTKYISRFKCLANTNFTPNSKTGRPIPTERRHADDIDLR